MNKKGYPFLSPYNWIMVAVLSLGLLGGLVFPGGISSSQTAQAAQIQLTPFVAPIATPTPLFTTSPDQAPAVQVPQTGATVTPTPTPKAAIHIAIDESYVNTIVQRALADEPAYSNPQVDLAPPNIAYVTVTMRTGLGVVLRPTATLEFGVVNNLVQVRITDVTFSGYRLLPRNVIQTALQGLATQMQNRINAMVLATKQATGLVVVGVSSTDTQLLIQMGEPTS